MSGNTENAGDSQGNVRQRHITQITLKLNPQDEISADFFRHIENRNRALYPTIFSYLYAAVEVLEVSADEGGEFPILSGMDLERIELAVLHALRESETKKKEERMVP